MSHEQEEAGHKDGPMPAGDIGQPVPPTDPLHDVFPPDVLSKWRDHTTSFGYLQERLNVLDASGPYPEDPWDAHTLRAYRARKDAWEAYLFAAFACGMFQAEKGKDLRGRLTGMDEHGFRSAMAECLACWFLGSHMKLPINPVAPGRDGKNLEMRLALSDGDVGVEVKAPIREHPQSPDGEPVAWFGDDSDKIAQSIEAANRQFSEDEPNILVIVPALRIPVYTYRHGLVRATFGQSKVTIRVNKETGEPIGSSETKFYPDGKFLNTRFPGKKGEPAFRRISAIICIEEKYEELYQFPGFFAPLNAQQRQEMIQQHLSEENQVRIGHNVLVVHNPYTHHPLSQSIWSGFPQFVPVGDLMEWTDGHETRV